MLRLLKKLFQPHYFVSEAGKFLQDFDQTNPQKSLAQQQEISKYERINSLRDHPVKSDDKNKIWGNF